MSGDFFLTTWFFQAMRWIYENLTAQNVFLTILICTIVLRALTFFSDLKTRKSTAKMAAIQPEIQKIQKKYKNDPRMAQQAQSKLMKEQGVSMWGSCLPMLITMPLFFCFIAAFRFWGCEQMIQAILEVHDTGSTQMFESFRFLWISNIWQADNGALPVVMEAKQFFASVSNMQNLIYFKENPAAFEAFKSLGLIIENTSNIPQTAIDTYNNLTEPFLALYPGKNNGWFLLPILAGGSNFLSAWLMQKSQPKIEGQAAGGGKMMMYIFPIMSFIFCLTNNSAFAIYWTLSSVLMIVTNLLLNKKFPRTVPVEGSQRS